MEEKKVVDPRYAKGDGYKDVIKEIADKGLCPFCPDNFEYHKNEILKKYGRWFITRSSWPYENALEHFLIIGEIHKEHISDLDSKDMTEVNFLAKWATAEFKLEGGVLALRFGATEYTGATVCHLHFHLVIPQKSKTVNFPIG